MDNADSLIYIFCPAKIETGGPEALHQLRFYMEQLKLNAFIVYFDAKDSVGNTPERYKIYNPKVRLIEDVEDVEANILIVPETSTILLNNFKKIRRCIWWLSVDYCDNLPITKFKRLKNFIKVLLGLRQKESSRFQFSISDCLNLCASKYAYTFLKKHKVKNIKYLVEPISKEFLDYNASINHQRNDKILYNPSKPSKTMDLLLKSGEFDFLPLKGYKPEKLIELYSKAKLYIDFGPFSGPERIPKEVVYFGTTILVNKRNAAKNNFDVAIPNKYKIRRYNNIDFVKKEIRKMLANFDENITDFIYFKEKIEKLEFNFINQIEDIFVNNNVDF